MRKQRLRYIAVLPSLVTLLNGICGLVAIGFASQGNKVGGDPAVKYFAMAGYMILFAMIADMLDGRLARMSQSTSSFGGQLDSLCDIVSFGVAPAFLVLKILEPRLAVISAHNAAIGSFAERGVWLAAGAYFSCAAIRLARFNVENEEDESAHMSFVGLPTPAAAGVIVSLILFHQEALPDIMTAGTAIYSILENAIIYLLPLVTLGIAVLMVSRIRYAHILNQYIKGKKPFALLIRTLLFLGLIVLSRQAALVLLFCGFAISGFAKWFYFRVIRKSAPSLAEPSVQ